MNSWAQERCVGIGCGVGRLQRTVQLDASSDEQDGLALRRGHRKVPALRRRTRVAVGKNAQTSFALLMRCEGLWRPNPSELYASCCVSEGAVSRVRSKAHDLKGRDRGRRVVSRERGIAARSAQSLARISERALKVVEPREKLCLLADLPLRFSELLQKSDGLVRQVL